MIFPEESFLKLHFTLLFGSSHFFIILQENSSISSLTLALTMSGVAMWTSGASRIMLDRLKW